MWQLLPKAINIMKSNISTKTYEHTNIQTNTHTCLEAHMRENAPPLRQRYLGKHQSGEKHKQTCSHAPKYVCIHICRYLYVCTCTYVCVCVFAFWMQYVWLLCRVIVGVEILLLLMFGLCCGVITDGVDYRYVAGASFPLITVVVVASSQQHPF